jgi:hypothetical protein
MKTLGKLAKNAIIYLSLYFSFTPYLRTTRKIARISRRFSVRRRGPYGPVPSTPTTDGASRRAALPRRGPGARHGTSAAFTGSTKLCGWARQLARNAGAKLPSHLWVAPAAFKKEVIAASSTTCWRSPPRACGRWISSPSRRRRSLSGWGTSSRW